MIEHDVFTDDAISRPLFEEPEPHIERVDAWSGPHGFLFGEASGMGGARTLLDIAQDYMEAAYVLSQAIEDGHWADYRLGHPLLFLYRHAVELFVKGVLPNPKLVHDLAALADDFAAFIHARHGVDVQPWIISRLKELAVIDKQASIFRYGGTVEGKGKQRRQVPMPGEVYVSLPHLQDAMVALNWALASVVGDISTERMEALALRHAQRRRSDD